MMIVDGSRPWDERFEATYRKHYGRVWRYFRANRIADDEAHDLAQDTFKRLYERMDQVRNDDPAALLPSIARTILYNRVRARLTLKRSAPTIDIDDPELMIDPPAPPEPDYAEREEERALWMSIRDSVAMLPSGQRISLRLWLEGFQYEEISKILGISMDAVKSRLRDAKRTLREQLGDKR